MLAQIRKVQLPEFREVRPQPPTEDYLGLSGFIQLSGGDGSGSQKVCAKIIHQCTQRRAVVPPFRFGIDARGP